MYGAAGSGTFKTGCTKLMNPSATCEKHAASILSEALAGLFVNTHVLLLLQGAAAPAASELTPHRAAARRCQTQVLPVWETKCSLG